jgi:hypothetical protein
MPSEPPPERVPVPTAISALLAPVVAYLRGADDDVRVLFEGACEDGTIPAALGAAPGVVRFYLRTAPPPDGADQILSGYVGAAYERFGDRDIVSVGAQCFEVARVDASLAPVAEAVFVDAALDRGVWHGLVGAVASCWWCAERGAAMRGADPVSETAAICRYLARVA